MQHIEEFNISNEISSTEPIPWCFRRVPDNERDEDSEKSGLKLLGLAKSFPYQSNISAAEKEITNKLNEKLSDADKKFKEYGNCLKILVIEICGDISSLLAPEVIVEIIENANVPHSIDQIWLADPEDEMENIITYHQLWQR